ncbi:hypothetical protein BIV57_21810, partial [Mangrovactinospora gilvigrisea]
MTGGEQPGAEPKPAPGAEPEPGAGPGAAPGTGERKEPQDWRLAPPALAAWLGAALGPRLPLAWPALLGGAAVLLYLWRRRPTAAAALLCALTAAAVAQAAAAQPHRGPLPALAAAHATVRLDATVTGDPVRRSPRVHGAAVGRAFVLVPATAELLRPGTRISTSVGLVYRDPAAARLLPGTRLTVTGRAATPYGPVHGRAVAAVVRVAGPPRQLAGPPAAQRLAGALREGLRRAADPLPGDARALLPGLVIGDTSRVPDDLEAAFRATDLTHLLAVSGANLSILLAVLLGAAARGGLPLRLTAVLGGAVVLGFTVLCRPDPSVLRAAAFGALALLALATGRRRAGPALLCGATLLLLLFAPRLAVSFGFLLSVLATAALLTVGPRWAEALRRRRVPAPLAEALAAAGAAQAATMPVIAMLAAQVSLVAVPCNLLAEPAVAPATVLGFAALAAAPLSPAGASGLAWLAGWPTRWIAAVARHGAALPGAAVPWPGGWTGAAAAAAALGAGGWLLLRVGPRMPRGGRIAVALLLAAVLLVVVIRPPFLVRIVTGWPPPGWRVVACDVGQGDAIVLATGTPGSAVVVDAGPDPAPVDRCLRRLGVRRIPLLVLTHFHADHVGGVPGVLRGRRVGEIEVSPVDEPAGGGARVARWAAA